MSNRWALFVDAGWLFAAGSTSAFGERLPRKDVLWNPASLVEGLIETSLTVVPPSTELLRVYWYDGAPNRIPIGEQLTLAALPDVKLRLGRTARDGQKGVDGLIIHDLITHAYRRTLDEAVVVSGDEDLLDAIDSAQANGTRVHLLEIPVGGIAAALLRAVDRRGELDQVFWKTHFERAETPNEVEEGDTETDVPADIPAPVEKITSPVVVGETMNPAPPLRAPVRHTVPAFGGPAVRPAWMDEPLPGSTPRVAPTPDVTPLIEAGEEFALEWLSNANLDEYMEMLASRPYLQSGIDTHLLRYATPDGRWLEETERRALRDGFWATVAAAEPPAE